MATNPTTALVRSGFASLMKAEPELREIYYNEYKRLPELFPQYMLMDTSDRKTETENVIGNMSEWTSHTEGEDYTYNAITQGTEVTVTHTTYSNGFSVSQELMEDNQWGAIMRGPQEMAAGGKSIAESGASTPFDNAFTSGTGSDGSYLCVTDHNLINSALTGSNAITNALSADGLEAAFIQASNTVDDGGVIINTNFDTLFVPPALRRTALELTQSALTPFSNNNATNIYKGMINKVVVCPYLASSTAWFLIDSSSRRRPKFFWRVRPQFNVTTQPSSLNSLMTGRLRFGTLFAGWQGVFGSTGTV
jgi:phage major head subunit gpT-like protein